MKLFLILICTTILAAKPLISETYGERFTRAELPTGEWEQVESVHHFDNSIWIYSKADRKIVKYDSAGTFLREIPLPSIGRTNYLGEDYVIYNSKIIFLNSVDCQLETFSLAGDFLKSIPFDRSHFGSESTRSGRIINQITIENGCLILGTATTSAVFNLKSGTFVKSRTVRTAIEPASSISINGKQYELHQDSLSFAIDQVVTK